MVDSVAAARFNWIDVVVICLILITTYNGTRRSFIIEFFKTIGVLASIYVSLHYFSRISGFFNENFPNIKYPFLDLFFFLALAEVTYLLIVLVRGLLAKLLKVEAASILDKWGGLFLGFFRGILLTSLLIFLMYISAVPYLEKSPRKSYLGNRLVLVDTNIYKFIFYGIVSKFSPEEKINPAIDEVIAKNTEAKL